MWDTLKKMEYRAKAGIPDAQRELACRRNDRIALPLVGIHGEQLYLTGAQQLQKQAEELDALYARLPARRGVQNTILLDAWSSATIEGARTTVDQVCQSFDHPKTKDDRMVVNAIHGSNYAYNHPITQKNIRTLWEMVVDGVCENAGKAGSQYRSGRVFIGNASRIIHEPASWEQLPDRMESWFRFRESNRLHPIVASFICHFYFVYVHPFCDGNGRIGRLWHTLLLSQWNPVFAWLPVESMIHNHQEEYYAAINASNAAGESTVFISFMLAMIQEALEEAVSTLPAEGTKAERRWNAIETFLRRREYIQSQDVQKLFDVSPATASRILAGFCKDGLLVKVRKGSYWVYTLS